MEEIDNCSEKYTNRDYRFFKIINEDFPLKPKREKQQLSFTNVNNKFTIDTFEDFYLKMNNEENNYFNTIFNENCQEDNQSLKIANFTIFWEKSELPLPLFSQENSKNKKQGRKKKESKEQGNHNKYTSDNIIRKCKTILINLLFNLINKKIKEIFRKEKGYVSTKKRLMKMSQTQIANSRSIFP